jgi:hypothetical protein
MTALIAGPCSLAAQLPATRLLAANQPNGSVAGECWSLQTNGSEHLIVGQLPEVTSIYGEDSLRVRVRGLLVASART